MRWRTKIAAASLLLAAPAAGPALADEACPSDASAAPCGPFIEAYRADGAAPVAGTDALGSEQAVIEQPQELSGNAPPEAPHGEDVLYWDGDSAMIVPDETGPRLKIADW